MLATNQSHRVRHLARIWIASVLAALSVIAASGLSARAASAATTGENTPTTERVGGRFQTIEQAVAAGRIDREVVDAVRAGKSADAIVTVEQAATTANTVASTPTGEAHRPEIITKMRAAFTAQKQRVFGASDQDVTVVDQYENLPATHVHVSSLRALLKLASSPDVTGVRVNHTMTTGSMDPQSAPLVRQPQATAAGYTGAGTYVAVLDTGVNYTLSDFGYCTAAATPAGCRVAGAYEFAPNDNYLDDDGHGTNVAGIVAGVAPGTKILALDVFNGGSTNDPYMLSAMNWLISQRKAGVNIVATNLSIWRNGYNNGGVACTDTLGFGAARAAGIVPVVIAGNGGATNGVSYPGCIPGALTVGAVYDSNVGSMSWTDGSCTDSTTYADKVTCFSQSGPNLAMLAPGSVITAAGISESGTSQAAPHVAGAVAVLAAAKPSANVGQSASLVSALVNSGPTILDRDGRYRHRLDVYSALVTLLGAADTTKPIATIPTQKVALDWGLGATAAPVTISWSATDASGIAGYDLWSSTNNGAYAKVTLPSATATSMTFDLQPGSTYQFAVQAKDGAGNLSNWSYGPSFRVDNYADSNTAVRYSTGWTRLTSATAYGGTVTATATVNASATFTYTGRGFAWIASRGTNRGQATVYVDGVKAGTYDLYSATTRMKNVFVTSNYAASGTHTVQIVAVGTAGRPAIDVDSFIVLT